MIELTPLRRGTISNIFNRVWGKVVSQYDLPKDPTQCVHLEEWFNSSTGKSEIKTCINPAVSSGRHGWLCKEHRSHQMWSGPRKIVQRDQDKEHTDFIIMTEKRAIESAKILSGPAHSRFKIRVLDLPEDHPTRREIRPELSILEQLEELVTV